MTTPTLSMAEVAVYATILQNIEQHPGVHQFSLSPSPEIILDVWLGAFSVFRLVLLRDVSQQRQREIEMHLYWSSVAHELRTPLTSILSHLEVSRSENVPADVQTHSLEIVHQQTHRLNNLINSTLDLGRLKSTTHLPKHSLDMILLAEEAIAELILLAEVKGVGLNFNFEPPIPPVLGNPDKLKQLMLNVLDNAIKYCQAGDTVTVLLTSTPEQVVCQITDTGAGIPAQHLPPSYATILSGATG
ncbi:MAG: HAMP domain-containing histidine kinase [Chloroflexi bacterium]|nr:HAMP domain-containing histidine kinase [Chloroflexota bacterium]